jgi:hypothetical protein
VREFNDVPRREKQVDLKSGCPFLGRGGFGGRDCSVDWQALTKSSTAGGNQLASFDDALDISASLVVMWPQPLLMSRP